MLSVAQHLALFVFLAAPIRGETISARIETMYVTSTVDEAGISDGYHNASNMFQGSLNESVNPCDDFFEFACGRWLASNKIPDDLNTYNHFAEIYEKINPKIKTLYEDPTSSTSKSINVLKQFYAACMDTDRLNELKSSHMIKDIESFGYWPILHPEKWDKSKFDFTELVINVTRSRLLKIFFTLTVSEDERNVSRCLLHFDQADLGLGSATREYYLNDTEFAKQLAAYEKLMNARIGLLAEDSNSTRLQDEIAADAKEILAYERQLAKIMVSEDQRLNSSRLYNKYHLSKLDKLIPIMDWHKYLRTLIPAELHDYLDSDPEIIINEPEYFSELAKLIKSTDSRILTNYIIWRFTGSWSLQLDERYENIYQEFKRDFTGQQSKPLRWKSCHYDMSDLFPYSTGAMYVRKHFKVEDREAAQAMVKDLQEAFTVMLKQNEWMKDETKQYALKKAYEMQSLIGFPDMAINDTQLDKYYEKLIVDEDDDYATLTHKHSLWEQDRKYHLLLQEVDRNDFILSPAMVNAFYYFAKNALIFPAAVLQPPLFARSFPKAVNYASIGSVIGHEITHGFDYSGSQFDASGNLRNWWDLETEERFKNLTKCIIDQYNNYVVSPGHNINGVLTQNENVADNGGIRIAYQAYRSYVGKLGHEDKRLPGYESYSNDQTFFIAYAQLFCSKSTEETQISDILTDPHSPMQYRVNGVLANQLEFADAFNCPVGSNINPEKKCVVW